MLQQSTTIKFFIERKKFILGLFEHLSEYTCNVEKWIVMDHMVSITNIHTDAPTIFAVNINLH